MSVGSQALERSALESKDRDSLLQIATAMGGKPGSRAKKADIVAMILDLAGVVETGDASAAAGDDLAPDTEGFDLPAPGDDDANAGDDVEDGDDADNPQASEAARRSDRSRERNRNRNRRDESDGDVDNTSAGFDDRANADSGAAGDTDDDVRDRDNRNDQGRDRNRDRGPRTEQNRTEQNRAGQGRPNGAATAAPAPASAADAQGLRDDGESGNRRRRRRGRDRERAQPGVPGQAAPATTSDDQFQGEPVEVWGLLDLRDEGYGFLRVKGYLPSKDDVYVSVKQVRQFGLRKGDELKGAARPASRSEKNPALLRIDEVNGNDPDESRQRGRFEDLTAVFPTEQLALEFTGDGANDEAAARTGRIIDLVAPVGKGTRGLIVAPPKSGRTTVLRDIALAIETNHPDVHLMVLTVDERPEEVTDLGRSIEGEVIASTFDRPADEHTMVVELALERAKRLVEEGRDVVIVADGLTRLARAYNQSVPPTGRIINGGIDTGALHPAKRFFGSARNLEEGGSLTILATALSGTGSRLDEAILDEFKGTANQEVHLDRALAERRIEPAIDVEKSSTRHDELLLGAEQAPLVARLRRTLAEAGSTGGSGAAAEQLLERISATPTNGELLAAQA